MNLINERSTRNFFDIGFGECFSYDNSFYMKINNHTCSLGFNAVSLSDGITTAFESSTLVVPVKIDGIIRDQEEI